MEAAFRQAVVKSGNTPPSPQVLIADDDLSYLVELERVFRLRGLTTISCTDGRKAWRAIQERPRIFLAVLNWMLPGIDGHIICRRLHEQRSTVVSVLMIGRRFEHEARTRLHPRAQHVLTKPFPEAGIDQQIDRIIRLASLRHAGPPFQLSLGHVPGRAQLPVDPAGGNAC